MKEVELFETGISEPGDRSRYWKPVRCRLCKRRFRRRSSNHGLAEARKNPGRVEVRYTPAYLGAHYRFVLLPAVKP